MLGYRSAKVQRRFYPGDFVTRTGDRETCAKENELWETLKQASFSLVSAKKREHAHDWLILSRAKMKSLFSALLCERRLLQICEEGKAFFAFRNFGY